MPAGHRLFLIIEVVSAVSALEPQQLSCRDQEYHCQLRSFRRQGKGLAHHHPQNIWELVCPICHTAQEPCSSKALGK